MAIWVTGDIHGDPSRLSVSHFSEQKEMTKQDENFVIICGDFGLVWDYLGESKTEKYWLNWLEDKKFTTLFVDGNHENHNRLDTDYPVEMWHGGKVHKIRPHVIHLIRGQVFDIEGKKFFTFGGASSHDIQDGIIDPDDFVDEDDYRREAKDWWLAGKMFRVKNRTWWERELPSAEEMEEGIENLKNVDNKVDYIISHCASTSTAAIMSRGSYKPDVLTDYFEMIEKYVDYKEHFFGHYHMDWTFKDIKQHVLYERIIRIN